MAPLKEYNNNFAASSMPIDVYADVVPQVDIGYQILPWIAGFFLLFLTANILRSIKTSSIIKPGFVHTHLLSHFI